MSQPELLKTVVRFLEQAGIECMLTGSLVSSLQGEPRSTHDIDFIVQVGTSDVENIVRGFPPPQYYVSESAILEAIVHKGMFNLLDTEGGDKVDFWLLTDEPFDRSRFARRQIEGLFGVCVPVSAPEDTILAKLRWAKLSGGSQKQLTDAMRVYELQRSVLDLEYIEQWAEELEVQALWSRLRREAEPLP
ncbi:MAG: hypothetical protein ABIP48_13075 [Planctomycetota bacterium]